MAVFKCKMCGGTLEVQNGTTICECEYCGTKQTIPSVGEDYLQNLFNRANALRMKAEFDKAADVYEKIIQEDQSESEAYWGLVLCKYGVEYVEDPSTLKRLPTCHRTSFDPVITDEDYLNAIKYADVAQKSIYEAEAGAIDEIQKGILAVASSESPYDVFICYKEADDQGKRTVDSVTANEIYYQLTQEGFKVFYAAISLEDKLGSEYEPYIFAALNSAKVMLVIGSKPEYFNAVWVKNEWSRFMKLMRTDHSRTLIPCYKDMDAYELPEEFAHLQAQDMSKIGFINDIIRGIRKLISAPEILKSDTAKEANSDNKAEVASGINIKALLKRAYLALEDGEWKQADKFCEKVLDADAENAQAYLGKLMSELRVPNQAGLIECASPFDDRNNYKKVIRFCDDALRDELERINSAIRVRNISNRKDQLYKDAERKYDSASTEQDYLDAAKLFDDIIPWRDSEERSKEARKKAEKTAETFRKDEIYGKAVRQMTSSRNIVSMTKALSLFESIAGWKDADAQIKECQDRIDEFKRVDEEKKERLEREAREKENKKKRTIRKVIIAVVGIVIIAVVAYFVITMSKELALQQQYSDAEEYFANGEYDEAIAAYTELGDYKDSVDKIAQAEEEKSAAQYELAEEYLTNGEYDEAIVAFSQIEDYEDASEKIAQAEEAKSAEQYELAEEYLANEEYDEAIEIFSQIGDYKDAEERTEQAKEAKEEYLFSMASGLIENGQYDEATDVIDSMEEGDNSASLREWVQNAEDYDSAMALFENGSYEEAIEAFSEIEDYEDSKEQAMAAQYALAEEYLSAGEEQKAAITFGKCSDYQDARTRSMELWHSFGLQTVSTGLAYTVAVKSDGTVVATGENEQGQCDVSDWTDIVSVDCGACWTLGLKIDGTVVSTGSIRYFSGGRYQYSHVAEELDFEDVVSISCCDYYSIVYTLDGFTTLGVEDGTYEFDTIEWVEVINVAWGESHAVGLKSDGSVVASGEDEYGQCDVSEWNDVEYIAAYYNYTYGIKADGTLLRTGTCKSEVDEVALPNWSGLAAVSAQNRALVGLFENGTVQVTGEYTAECDTSNWTDIQSIACGKAKGSNSCFVIGLRNDGTLVATGNNDNGQCDVSEWTDIQTP